MSKMAEIIYDKITMILEQKAKEYFLYKDAKPDLNLTEKLLTRFENSAKTTSNQPDVVNQSVNNYKKYLDRLTVSLEENFQLFEDKFASQYPNLNIREELINLCSTDCFISSDFNTEITTVEKLQWCSAVWLKNYITVKDKEDELDEIIKADKSSGYNVPGNFQHILNATDTTNFNVDRLIAERFGKRTETHMVEPSSIPDSVIENQGFPDTEENERFQSLLYLVEDEDILRLKQDFLNNIFKIFDTYLKIKSQELEKLKDEKIQLEFGAMTPQIVASILTLSNFINLYTTEKFTYGKSEVSEIIGTDAMKQAQESIKDINALDTSFIAFFMLNTEDNLFWLYPLTRCLLQSTLEKLPLTTILNSALTNSNPEVYSMFFTDKKTKVKVQVENPDAPISEMRIRWFPKKEKNSLKTYMTFEQFIYSVSGLIDNAPKSKQAQYCAELFKRAGVNDEKAYIISYIATLAAHAGIRIRQKQHCIELNREYKNKLAAAESAKPSISQQEKSNQKQPPDPVPNLQADKQDKQKEQLKTKAVQQSERRIAELQKTLNIKDRQIKHLQTQIDAGKAKNNKEAQYFKDKASKLENKINDIKSIMKRQVEERAKELVNDYLIEMIDEQLKEEESKTDITFPIILNKKITVFGGHETWVKQIQQYLPDVTFYPRDKNPDEQLIRNSDHIWIQENAICHSFYHKIADILKGSGRTKDLSFFNSSSAETCAKKIVTFERKNSEQCKN